MSNNKNKTKQDSPTATSKILWSVGGVLFKIETFQLSMVSSEGRMIQYIPKPSESVQLVAVNQNPMAICFIKDPSEAVQLLAVTQSHFLIEKIKNPAEKAQLTAVNGNGTLIRYIENPSEAVQLAAVAENGFSIQYIQNPSEALQLIAVRGEVLAIEHIKNPCEEALLAAFAVGGFLFAGQWEKSFRPSALVLKQAIQDSGCAFERGSRESDGFENEFEFGGHNIYDGGVEVIKQCLQNQPADGILDLAAVAPDLFAPPELLDILRNALLQQAATAQIKSPPRLM